MKEEQDYIRDIAEIRSMMERSSKFLSLSGWAGVMAGIYALLGAFLVYRLYHFNPDKIDYAVTQPSDLSSVVQKVVFIAITILVLAIVTAILLSNKKARNRGEQGWNTTTRRMLLDMAIPLVTGGLLILVLLYKGLIGFAAPFSLLFYGLALYNASKFTYAEIRSLGLIQIVLGLFSSYFIIYGLLCWAIGFGVFHIIYGVIMHYKYER